MKTLTAEEQTMYREMLGARKRLQANDKDAMELVMDLVVDFALWLERRKPKRKVVPTRRTFTTAQQESGFANYPETVETPKRIEKRWWRPSAEKAKPGPEAELKPSRKGERQRPKAASVRWKAGTGPRR